MASTVKLTQVCKQFGQQRVIDAVSLDINPGELVVFVGPSGCGKSTLLRLIAGLEQADSGSLHIGDRDVTDVHPSKRGIAMVFQSYALYPHMSVADNMGFGLRIRGESKAVAAEKVRKAAQVLQLDHLLERKPKQLSGGQRQRVAIGRAIVREPEVFLFDEPLSNLDAALRGQMRVELARLHAQLQATMIYVTHDQVEAMTLADRIVVLSGGRIEQVGTPMELYHTPTNRFVAGFIGAPSMNFIHAHVRDWQPAHADIDTPGDALRLNHGGGRPPDTHSVVLGLRPEHARLVAHDDSGLIANGEIVLIERLGAEALAHVRIADHDEPLVVTLPGDSPASRGDRVGVTADPDRCHLFDEQGRSLRARG